MISNEIVVLFCVLIKPLYIRFPFEVRHKSIIVFEDNNARLVGA